MSFCGGVGGGGGFVITDGNREIMGGTVWGGGGDGEKQCGGSPGHGGAFFSIENC